MKHKDIIILEKILQYIKQIEDAMIMFHRDFHSFENNSVFQNACCMCVLQIGELAKALSAELKENYSDVPWKEWCGIRDIFAHQYSNLDIASAWATLMQDIPELDKRCKEILRIQIEDCN